VFNDITTGTIAMPCSTGTLDCTTTAAGLQPLPQDVQWPRLITIVTLVCVMCIGTIVFRFRGSSRRWITAMSLLAVAALAANAAGCGGGSGGGGGVGGGGGGGTPAIGVQSGFNAGPGYDLATGLGSVNVLNLVNAAGWAGAPVVPDGKPPMAPSRVRWFRDRNWQAAARAIAIACVFCIAILLLGFRRRPVRA
jgi:hypothetical protein